jgi:hypothetical protein
VPIGLLPEIRYTKTLNGRYIAYKVLGEGAADVAIIGSIATNVEVSMNFEPAARFWFAIASNARLTLHDRRGTGCKTTWVVCRTWVGLPNLENAGGGRPGGTRCSSAGTADAACIGDGGMVATRFPRKSAGQTYLMTTLKAGIEGGCGG